MKAAKIAATQVLETGEDLDDAALDILHLTTLHMADRSKQVPSPAQSHNQRRSNQGSQVKSDWNLEKVSPKIRQTLNG
jgi:hypothetical protein